MISNNTLPPDFANWTQFLFHVRNHISKGSHTDFKYIDYSGNVFQFDTNIVKALAMDEIMADIPILNETGEGMSLISRYIEMVYPKPYEPQALKFFYRLMDLHTGKVKSESK